MPDLNDYTDGNDPNHKFESAPVVMLNSATDPIRPPGKPGKIAGYTGKDRKRGKTYVARKVRGKHLYRKRTAYAMSRRIIGMLQSRHVEYVTVYETDTENIYVFTLSQFAGGSAVPDAPDADPQNYVPTADAHEVWHDVADPIVDCRAIGNAQNGRYKGDE